MNAPIVDAHLHVWEMPSERYPWSPLRNMRPQEAASVERLRALMAQHGVEHAIIVQPSNYGYDHRYVLDCLQRYPGQFGAVALLDFTARDAPSRLIHLVEQGIRAVRLYLYHEEDLSWLANGTLDPLLETASALSAVMCVFGPWHALSPVYSLADRHRGVRFVLDHLGHPDIARPETWSHILRFADVPNVCIKVSDLPTVSRVAYPFTDVFPFVREVLARFGPRRMMWGSNYPHILRHCDYEQALRLISVALPNLPAEERAWIMGGTAAELWGLGGR